MSAITLLMFVFFAMSFTSCGGKKEANEETATEHMESGELHEDTEHPAGGEHPAGSEHPTEGDSTSH